MKHQALQLLIEKFEYFRSVVDPEATQPSQFIERDSFVVVYHLHGNSGDSRQKV